MRIISILLGILTGIMLAIGVPLISKATEGVGVIAAAAVVGILARLCQASSHDSRATKRSAALMGELAEIRRELDTTKRVLAAAHNIDLT